MENIELTNFEELSFGENTNQSAQISPVENGIEYEILSDNNVLEYIDYLNLTKAIEIIAEFFDVNSVAIAKENKLCAVALGSSIEAAFEKIVDCDPLAVIGSSVGFSKELTLEVAKQLNAMRVRNVIATKYSKDALEYILNNSEINVIQVKSPLQELLGFNAKDIKVTPFGYLVQSQNDSKLTKSTFQVAGKT